MTTEISVMYGSEKVNVILDTTGIIYYVYSRVQQSIHNSYLFDLPAEHFHLM